MYLLTSWNSIPTSQRYGNNRSNSFVKDGVLYIRPTLTADTIGDAAVMSGYDLNIWGGAPADVCTSNAFYGCERTSGAGGNAVNPVRSARVRTAESFSFKYGKVEVKAAMPKGDWMWPAIWMLPTDQQYGEWPASGEIDIVESRGNDASYAAGGVNQFGSTLHWGPHWPEDPYTLTHATYTLPSGDLSQDFHVYGLVWSEEEIFTYIDTPDQVVLSVPINQSFWQLGGWDKTSFDNPWAGRGNAAPFDREFYLILNVAVGGTNAYFPDGVGGKPWTNADQHAVNAFWNAKQQWYSTWQAAGDAAAMRVESVMVWQ